MRAVLTLDDIDIFRHLLVHEGGTKFYETFWIRSEKHDQAVVINRWGKVAQIKHGGVINRGVLMRSGDEGSLHVYLNKVVDDKMKRGYVYQGTGKLTKLGTNNKEMTEFLTNRNVFYECSKDFESAPIPNTGRVQFFTRCGICSKFMLKDFIDEFRETTPEMMETPPEIVIVNRSENWGTW